MEEWKQHKEFETFNNLRKANAVRKAMGLPKLVEKTRDCLSCENEFKSAGAQNRLCRNCRIRKHGRSDSQQW